MTGGLDLSWRACFLAISLFDSVSLQSYTFLIKGRWFPPIESLSAQEAGSGVQSLLNFEARLRCRVFMALIG